MYQVMNWLIETALARQPLDTNQIAECVKHPTLPAFTESAISERTRRNIIALKELRQHGRNMGAAELQEVLTTAHFSQYFADAISRRFYDEYETQIGQWQDYIYPDTTPDFREVKRFRMSRPGKPSRRREKAEAKAGYIAEDEKAYAVDEWAMQMDFSWHTIRNDDLGEIAKTPARMAKSMAEWLDEWVSDLYDNATTQATLAALGAPWAGTGRLTIPNLSIGINAMMQRTDAQGKRINIKQVWLVIPPILKIQAAQILKDLLSFGGPNGNVLNEFVAGIRVDPYIATSGPDVPWYLFGDPKSIPVVTVARLQGWTGPVVTGKEPDRRVISGSAPAEFLMGDFHTGNIEYDVTDVVGADDDPAYVGVTDYRGLYYSSGTTA